MHFLRILPATHELERGILRRTPRLRAWELEGAIQGEGWCLRPLPDGEWYEAAELYQALGLHGVPRPFVLDFRGPGVARARLAERASPRRPLRQLEEEPSWQSPQEVLGREEAGKPALPPRASKRAVLSFKEGVWTLTERTEERAPQPSSPASPAPWGQASPPPPPPKAEARQGERAGNGPLFVPKPLPPAGALHEALVEVLGQEEFAPEGVEAYLRFKGWEPEAVWEALERAGLLRKNGAFWSLASKSPVKRLVIEEDGLPSYLRPPAKGQVSS